MSKQNQNSNFHFVFVLLYSYPHPQGIEAMRSVLTKYKHKTSQIFIGNEFSRLHSNALIKKEDFDILIDKLREIQPTIVGMGLYSFSLFLESAKYITERIQKELKIPVIWGGPHVTGIPEDCIQIADMICIGEGEEAVLELAERLSNQEDVSDIRNIWIRRNGKIVRNEIRPLVQNLDWVPLPDYDVRNTYYINREDRKERHIYSVMATRGCPFSCSYCYCSYYNKMYKMGGKIVRMRSVENVIDELCRAKEHYEMKFVSFLDDIFGLDISWTRSFCKMYKSLINLPFFCNLHHLTINEEKLDLLIDAGLTHTEMGIQSGSYRVRREVFDRDISDEITINTSLLFQKYKSIRVTYDVIVDNPYETNEDKKSALSLLLKLNHPFEVIPSPLAYLAGTTLTERALKDKLISSDDMFGKTVKTAQDNRRIDVSNYCSRKEEVSWAILISLLGHSYKGCPIYPKWLIRLLVNNRLIQEHPRVLLFLVNLIKIFVIVFISSKRLNLFKKTYLYLRENGFKKFLKRLFSIHDYLLNLYSRGDD